jgi:large repetitive protein
MLLALLPPAHAEDAAPGSELLDVYRAGELAVVHDPDGRWQAEFVAQGAEFGAWYRDSVRGAFLRAYDDEYTFLTVLVLSDALGTVMSYASYANDVAGIGIQAFDASDGALEGLLSFSRMEERFLGCEHCLRYGFGQEIMHRWGAHVTVARDDLANDALLGRDGTHWSYFLDTPNSPMEGNRWIDNGDGTWTIDPSDYDYGALDLYLMGFLGEADVPPMTLLSVSEQDAAAAGVSAETSPAIQTGEVVTLPATPVTVTLDDIVAAEGPRDPGADTSPRSFRMAFVVLALSGDTLDDDTLAAVDALREELEADWEDDVGGRADLVTTLGSSTAATWGGDEPLAAPADEGATCGCRDDDEHPRQLPWAVLPVFVGLAGRRRDGTHPPRFPRARVRVAP